MRARAHARPAAAMAAAALVAASVAAAAAGDLAGHPDFEEFAAGVAERNGFDVARVRDLLGQARLNPRVLELATAPSDPGRKVYWREYRRRFLEPRVVRDGVRFHREHRRTLERASGRYGVPAEIIVAIIGIETKYGGYLGNFRVLDALATLGFGHPTRWEFFRGELEALLLLAADGKVDPLRLSGSYAGAFGMCQFLPSSFARYAVDFDGDGLVDLFAAADAIGSVGSFLAAHGWERGVPVAFPATVRGELALEPSVEPALTLGELRDGGLDVDFGGEPPFDGPYAVVDLEDLTGTEYRAGTANYYSLTRYNRSNKYAMAVLDLGEAIGARVRP